MAVDTSFLDEMNGKAKRPGRLRIDEFLGTHAVEVVNQQNTTTEAGEFIVYFTLRVISSKNDSLGAGAELTHGLLRQSKYPTYFERDSRLWFGALNQVDPADEAAWGDFIREGEGDTHTGKQLVVNVTDVGKKFPAVTVAPGPNLK